ncbi:hypothetical protein BDR04DRAFT_367627 [Suillus decipiens]|nr:hypothetical protein BDR04DRAFT_367627 [Suillus decipiens]
MIGTDINDKRKQCDRAVRLCCGLKTLQTDVLGVNRGLPVGLAAGSYIHHHDADFGGRGAEWWLYIARTLNHHTPKHSPLAYTHPSNMAIVSNDPSWWPLINLNMRQSYWMVAAGVVVAYDWVLTLGQEIELIWRQRWSIMTVLYLAIRYIGIPYSVYVFSGYTNGLTDRCSEYSATIQ